MIQWQYWPVFFICAAMLASAIIDWWKFKVPNLLTMPVIVSGWLFGLLHTCGVHTGGAGGIGYALLGTLVGMLLLIPYMLGGMGAGDVKMCMGFGAWIGAYYGDKGDALTIILYSQFWGIIVGGIIAVIMILLRGEFRKNLEHTRAILMDVLTAGSLGKVAERANERRPRWHRLPYGVPMCIGFLLYLGWVQPTLPTDAEPVPEQVARPTSEVHAACPERQACAFGPGLACPPRKPGTTGSFVTAVKKLKFSPPRGRN
jgi:prepilin peptidase CpaA